MGPILVEVTITGIKTFKDHTFKFNFRNERRTFATEVEDSISSVLSGSNYRSHVYAIAGINASGKSTTLNLLQFVLEVFFNGQSLNDSTSYSFNSWRDVTELFDDIVTVELYVHKQEDRHLLHTKSIIEKEQTTNTLRFTEEFLFDKKLTKRESLKSYMEFPKEQIEFRTKRSLLPDETLQFMKKDDSMITPLLNTFSDGGSNYIESTIHRTNINLFPWIHSDELLPYVLAYLDPSIEDLQLVKNNGSKNEGTTRYRLKFNHSEPVIIPGNELQYYLSSGTLRGLDLYGRIARVLRCGGYLLIDEIENHFNKVLVESIIDLFQSPLNEKGATLIFSTHYSELLDVVKRKDGIKVLRKSQAGIELDSLSSLAEQQGKDRSDIKNSDLILSGIFNTAPPYEEFWQLRKALQKFVRSGDSCHEE